MSGCPAKAAPSPETRGEGAAFFRKRCSQSGGRAREPDRLCDSGPQAGDLPGILGVQVIGKGVRVSGVVREHVPVAGKDEAGTEFPGRVGGLLEGHVADAVPAIAGAVPSVDGQQRRVDRAECLQIREQAFIAQGIARVPDAQAVSFYYILKTGIQPR